MSLENKTKQSSKLKIKNIFVLVCVLLFFGLIVFLAINVTGKPKTPATGEQVYRVLEEKNYFPIDLTEHYFERNSNFKNSLIKCIGFETSNMHFEFFEFKDTQSAQDIYKQSYDRISDNFDVVYGKKPGGVSAANYKLFFLDNQNVYSVAIYVGNTAVYAYCDSKDQAKLNAILSEIDYLEQGNNKK